MAEGEVGTSMECGFCLQKDSALVEPKLLPCSHAHCHGCLTAYFNLLHVVRCPTCKEVYDVTLESLPTAHPIGDNSPCCDFCAKKGRSDEPAETYCMTCSKKYCRKHLELHDELLDGHPKISITEYQRRAGKLEVRSCTEHGLPLVLGCKSCCTVICLECTGGLGVCTEDKSHHEMIALDILVRKITNEINELRAKVLDREEILDGLFKKTSEIIADYETETKEMIERIHQRRDEQIKAIKEKYETLERELIKVRAQCKSAMTKFMEEVVGVNLSHLSQSRMKTEARVKHSHQVDMVTGYRNTKDNLQKLLEDVIPELRLEGLGKLNTTDVKRDIELELVYAADGLISWEEGLTVGAATPKSIKLLKTLKLTSPPNCVCHYQGNLYVGLDDRTVKVVNDRYQIKGSLVTYDSCVDSLTIYKNRVYARLNNKYKVYVHNLSGQFSASWDHTDICTQTGIIVISDKIVIPDEKHKRLTLYSLSGQIQKHIPCPLLGGNDPIAICAVDSDSLIISNSTSYQVFRVNLSVGEVVWTSTHVKNPRGVACYGSCVLIASEGSKKIQILDVRTGNFLCEVTAEGLQGDAFDLCVFGNILVIPAYDKKELLYYQIE